jgi:uncharacterized damage-inducible protein DinB
VKGEIPELFVDYSAIKLRQMSTQIEACLGRLTDEQIWTRGAAHENSVGNLVLHLCGNMRQWMIAGVGGEKDVRDRDAEFSAKGGIPGSELVARLKSTVEEALAVLDNVTAKRLMDQINPQNYEVSVLEAIYQVVGHFQLHTGQIIFATKIYSGEDLGFYRPGGPKVPSNIHGRP